MKRFIITHKILIYFIGWFIVVINLFGAIKLSAQDSNSSIMKVKKSNDFTIPGDGSATNWFKADWMDIPQRESPNGQLTTKAKVLYSKTGIYFLFDCQDRKLSATMKADFMNLWEEDVVEVFLWTDENSPVYFEYELSPLNYELAILVSNEDGNLVRWQPFHYDKDRRTRHATTIQGGEKRSNSMISGWTAEFFIPYKLLRPLNNISPKPGTEWRVNLYRWDYDEGNASWSWQLTDKSFHEYQNFGTLLFE